MRQGAQWLKALGPKSLNTPLVIRGLHVLSFYFHKCGCIHKAGYIFSSKKKHNFYALRFVYLIIHIMVVYVQFFLIGNGGGI